MFALQLPATNKALACSLPLLVCRPGSPPASILMSPSPLLVFLLPLSSYLLVVSLYHLDLQLKPVVLKLYCTTQSPKQL